MSDITVNSADSTQAASPLETGLQLNPDGKVSLILSEEEAASFQAKERGRFLEAQRLKERLSQVPFYAERAALYGEQYWLDLASTYQGTD